MAKEAIKDFEEEAALAHMAVHACTTRDGNGLRFVDRDFLAAMPLREYKALLGKARGFLLRWGSQPTK